MNVKVSVKIDVLQDHGMVCVGCSLPLLWCPVQRVWGLRKEGVHAFYAHPWSSQPHTHDHYPMPKGEIK